MRYILLFILGILGETIICAQTIRIYGYVRNAVTYEPIPYAYCINVQDNKVVVSNEEGFFSLLCNPPTHIKFSYVGSIPAQINVTTSRDTFITVYLQPDTLEEVEVKAQQKLYLQTLLGKTTLLSNSVIQAPTFVGIPDGLKAITTLPGVTPGKDGFSFFNVRGGAPVKISFYLMGYLY